MTARHPLTWNFVRNVSNLTTTVTTPQLADTPNASDTVYTFLSTGNEVVRHSLCKLPWHDSIKDDQYGLGCKWYPQPVLSRPLEDNATKAETDTSYDSNGLLDSVTEYDWGTGTHGSASPIRTTTYSYQTSSNYNEPKHLNLVTSKQIKDASGTVQYRQDITYDGVALTCPPGAAQHDDSDYPCTSNYRGNLTAVTNLYLARCAFRWNHEKFHVRLVWKFANRTIELLREQDMGLLSHDAYSQPDSVTSGTSPNQLTTGLPLRSLSRLDDKIHRSEQPRHKLLLRFPPPPNPGFSSQRLRKRAIRHLLLQRRRLCHHGHNHHRFFQVRSGSFFCGRPGSGHRFHDQGRQRKRHLKT